MKQINILLITTIFSFVSSAHAGFIPLDLLDTELNDKSIYAAQYVNLGAGSTLGGNMQGFAPITTSVNLVDGVNITAGTAVTSGAGSSIGGYIQAGTTAGTGANSIVGGDIEAGGLYKAGSGDDAQERVKDWQEILDDNRDKDIDEQLYSINRFFNRLDFVDDLKQWNKNDYWATPVEFLSTNGGDCEDFSIAKYFSLRDMGVSAEKLRLMYVKALRYNMAHMVLAYYETPKSIPLILDNLNKDILPANKRRDLRPVYSFNGEGLWIAKKQGRGKQVQEGGNNVLWEDLKKRMIQELNNKDVK
jgi:predicted transglutaminase-like cysteine proteinase